MSVEPSGAACTTPEGARARGKCDTLCLAPARCGAARPPTADPPIVQPSVREAGSLRASADRCSSTVTAVAIHSYSCRAVLRAADWPRQREKAKKVSNGFFCHAFGALTPSKPHGVPAPHVRAHGPRGGARIRTPDTRGKSSTFKKLQDLHEVS